jgi:2-haloacid dehalogenase
MPTTLAFDVYGTLIDTQGIVGALENIVGDKAAEFSRAWRDKQLEYAFRRGLMQNYENFDVCASQALDYTCACYKIQITPEQKTGLLGLQRRLPAFADVKDGLARLKAGPFCMYAFSNGQPDAVESLLASAGIREFFQGVVSVDGLKSYKPSPAAYRHFLDQAGASAHDAWLISSNAFDVIGAMSSGMKAAWVKRSADAVFDPWGMDPTLTVGSLADLSQAIAEYTLCHGR